MKKRILIFIDWYLPGYKAGGPIQSVANLIEHLKDEFNFLVVTRDTDYCEITPYASVKSDEWNVLPNGTQVYYISKNNLNRSTIKNIIQKTDCDFVYLNGIYSLFFTLLPLFFLRKKKDKKIVISARGMLAASALGVKKTKKMFFIRSVKILNLFDKVIFHATNQIEEKDIEQVLGEKYEVKIAANLPPKNKLIFCPSRDKQVGNLKIVNVARIAPEKNLLFALKVLKNVDVDVIFDFYGPIYDQDYWNLCKSALDELPQNVKAFYKGSIESEKVIDLLQGYHFMFMPTQGENFGHIILQSLMVGCPVIISDQTPWGNLEEKNIGWDFNLNKPDLFSNKINDLSKMNQQTYNVISKAAFDYADNYASNLKILEQNKLLFK